MPSPCTIRCNTRTTWWKRTSPWRIEMRPSRGFVLLTVLVFAGNLLAGSLEVIVKDDKGGLVSDAVVYATAAGAASAAPKKHAVVDQRAKKFELPLYSGVPAEPVVFDKVGFITLGCNIHDWMIAYVAVLPTPYFQVTGQDGHVALKNLPPSQYTIFVWHPLLKKSPEESAQHLDLTRGDAREVSFTLDLKPDFRARRVPALSNGGYR